MGSSDKARWREAQEGEGCESCASKERTWARREAIRVGGLGLFGWLAAGSQAGCLQQIAYRAEVQGGEAFVPKAKLEEGEGKAVLLVEAAGRKERIYLRKTGQGYAAVGSRCTHRGCELDPEPSLYICPCHGARFSLEGSVLKGPARRSLPRFSVRETPEGLWLQIIPQGGGSR